MIFKKISEAGIFIQSVLLLAVMALLLFTPSADLSFNYNSFNSIPLFDAFKSIILPDNLLSKLSEIVIFVIIGYLFNLLAIKNELIPKKSIFILLIFVLFLLIADSISGNFVTPVVTLLLLNSLYNVIRMFSEQNAYSRVMNAAISVSIASLLYPQSVIFIIFIWLSFFTLRISSWREWVISIVGLLTPYFYFAVYLFLTDKLPLAYAGYKQFFMIYQINFNGFGFWEVMALILPLIMLMLSIPVFVSDASERVIAIRKKMWLMLNFLWIGIIVFIISGKTGGVWLPALFIPIALIFAHRIVTKRKSWSLDFLMILFICLVVLLRIG
ncbi:MAG: hypothetical protein K0B15_11415 [Lentimicrobium sp.]|nr:hypothetical protein [Lentimicrobium sp.]